MKRFVLTSEAFRHGDVLPTRFTADGLDLSPPLAWHGVPDGTVALALLVEDPDAPGGTFAHWLLWGLPTTARALPEGVPRRHHVVEGARQGRNDYGRIGWGGPSPPVGPAHRYAFRLCALDRTIALAPAASLAELLQAIDKHVLAVAELVGTYGRR